MIIDKTKKKSKMFLNPIFQISADCKSQRIIIKSVFSADLPPKKHRKDEQSESARRGELSKIADF